MSRAALVASFQNFAGKDPWNVRALVAADGLAGRGQSSPYFSIHACGSVPKLRSQSLNCRRLHPRPTIRR